MATYNKQYLEECIAKPMVFEKTFEGNGESFNAVNAAEAWLKGHGFTLGSMQRDAPIGVARESEYISKWFNLGDDVKLLDGAILGEDKRNGPVTVCLAFDPG